MPPASSSQPIGLRGRRAAIGQPAAHRVNPMTAFENTSRLFSSAQLRSEANPQPTTMTTSADTDGEQGGGRKPCPGGAHATILAASTPTPVGAGT